MDEQQVRLLVRQAIARHMGAAPAPAAVSRPVVASAVGSPPAMPVSAGPFSHVSFARFHLVRPAGETECLIEPSVTCNHCGHCQCYGH